jgi:iron(III) transport system substrate-binding protein
MHKEPSRGRLFFVLLLFMGLWVVHVTVASRVRGAETSQEWQKTLKDAEAEGEVTVYVAGYPHVMELFQKVYPKIKLVMRVGARGTDIANMVMAERRAGKHLADVYTTGQGTHISILYPAKALVPMADALILREVKDESLWFGRKHLYIDPAERYSFIFNRYVTQWIDYNKNLVDPKEISSYKDLLNPKWKGKIVMYDPTIPGRATPALWFFHQNPALGPEFMRKFFGDADVQITRDQRLAVDWVATGKAVICVACPGMPDAIQQGLPIGSIVEPMKEGEFTPYGFGVVSLIEQAPHPNAAKVFVNWLLSRQGQVTFQEVTAKGGDPQNSLRVDIPKDTVPKHMQLKDGGNYWREGPNSAEERKDAIQLLKIILAKKK